MTRRKFIGQALGGGAAVARAAAPDRRPNFVFILTDDQRWDSLGCNGHPFARTPNIDRLAKEGARFTNAFVTTSLCSPSRASFLTGQYAHLHGVRDNVADLHDTAAWTFPRVLQQAGYDTGFFGKWHMGYDRDSPRPGFHRWVSFKGQGAYVDPLLNIDGEQRRITGYVTDLLTDHAADWIGKKRNRPFLVYLSHKAVHTPLIPAPRHETLYSGVMHPRPKSFDESYEGKPAWLRARRRDRTGVEGGLKAYGSLDEFVRRYHRTLAAVDDSVGRVLQALDQTGQLENTVVIFAGDNGFFLGEHGLINKRAMYEESIRIPLLVRYPKLIQGNPSIDRMVLNIDLAPAILDLAGVAPPKAMTIQGTSWKPLLVGETGGWRDSWLYEYYFEPRYPACPTVQGVRTDRWKYIRYPDIDDLDEMYDLENDPFEIRNLSRLPAARPQLERMRADLFRLLRVTQAA